MNDAANGPAMLAARGLRKSYVMGKSTLDVLRGIDLTVQRGEFLALRGASGAGKSTLLHLLGGLDLPNQGEILFDGVNLLQLSPGALAQLRNSRVGFIFQAYHLLPELSAMENVLLPARMARMAPEAAETRARMEPHSLPRPCHLPLAPGRRPRPRPAAGRLLPHGDLRIARRPPARSQRLGDAARRPSRRRDPPG